MQKCYLYILLILVGCTSTVKQPNPEQIVQVTYQEKISAFKSCTGKGRLTSSGLISGKLSFDFMSQNDSSFFKFNDPLGRKILLLWITPNQVSAWNLIDNKQYTYEEVVDFFPLLNVIEPIEITHFLWGVQPNIEKINSEIHPQLSIKFEWKELNENQSELTSVHFIDPSLSQSVKINIKERTPNQSLLDFSKVWRLINT